MEIPIILGLSMAALLISLISIGMAAYAIIFSAQRKAPPPRYEVAWSD